MSTPIMTIFLWVLFLDGLHVNSHLLTIILLETFKVAVINVISKIWIYAIGIVSAVFAKISYDVLTGRKLTFGKTVAITCISLFAGYLTTFGLILIHYPVMASILGPLVTFLGEKLFIQLSSDDSIKEFIHAARTFLGNYIKPKS